MNYWHEFKERVITIWDILESIIAPYIYLLKAIVISMVILLIIGVVIDYKKRNTYSVKKIHYRTIDNQIGSGEEYYYRYWAWQRNKKKYLTQVLEKDSGVSRVYSRKALKKHWNKKTCVPFLREVYGNAK